MGFLLFFFCLPFPFRMFACLFETSFPNIPFLKPKLLSLLAVYFFFCCSCFCFHGVCFSLLCFYVGFVFGILLFFICVFAFVLLLVLLSVYEQIVFPAILVFFWVMLLKRVVCFFYVFCFCSCLFFLCCLFPFIELICIILFLCCCFFVTRLSGFLFAPLWSFFFFCFLFCFEFIFCFFIPLKKRPPNKTGHSKTPKMQKNRKNGQKKSVSAVVFTNSVI